LDNEDRELMMKAMSDNFDCQDEPRVGIFWYSVRDDALIEVVYSLVSECPIDANGYKTIRMLHQSHWKKRQMRCRAKGTGADYLKSDWISVPRGRVFQLKDGTFRVMTGSWIASYPQVKDEILFEFNLPPARTKFQQDSHWDIGKGWDKALPMPPLSTGHL
jgi:hypothetical protein